MEEDAFTLETSKLSIGDGDEDRFKDEDVEEEKVKASAAGSAKKPKKKTPIKTSNTGVAEPSSASAQPLDREQQRKLQLAADQENAADLFGRCNKHHRQSLMTCSYLLTSLRVRMRGKLGSLREIVGSRDSSNCAQADTA